MAALQERNGSYRILFRFGGKQHTLPVGKVTPEEAEAFLGKVEHLLLRIEQRWVSVPLGVGIVEFLLTDGQVKAPDQAAAPAEPVTLKQFIERYLKAHGGRAMEDSSLATAALHLRHFRGTFGEGFKVARLTLSDLQRHVTRRGKKLYRGRPLSAVTLRKEVATFRAAWNWAAANGLVNGPFPSKGLVYPKSDEKTPFMTMAEIERRLAGEAEGARSELWDSLYLRKEEIDDLLKHVEANAAHPWIYPMFCVAAHTGARRSELLRAEAGDVDLEAGTLLIREKKRSRKQRTTRQVTLTPLLKDVLARWLKERPAGSKYLFCQSGQVARSRKRSGTTGHRGERTRPASRAGRQQGVRRREAPPAAPVTKDEAHDHFRRTLAGSKWAVLKGFHVLRHSFISSLAAAGVDQRIIDDFVGHATEEQRRYRHPIPDVKQEAVRRVFG